MSVFRGLIIGIISSIILGTIILVSLYFLSNLIINKIDKDSDKE